MGRREGNLSWFVGNANGEWGFKGGENGEGLVCFEVSL